jgi:dihydropyrimidine dehydrogenase (NAD+) subunit PreT
MGEELSMPQDETGQGIAPNRLTSEAYQQNFSELHPPFDSHEAAVEADRCYFCYDAPCVTACPTQIDIPMFIRQISTGNSLGAARTIFDQNIMGGMCARVCPTETLCEEVCVREIAEGKPVKIGLLQRYATDMAMEQGVQFYERAPATGRKIAIVGAGPAGLACAHRLALHGHEVMVFEARGKPAGLNEYGIAAYKTVDDFAQREVDYISAIGGIEFSYNKGLGRDFNLADLLNSYDAVFLSIGLGAVNALGIENETIAGVENAVDWIEQLRQATDLSKIPVGRRVVVIGGGMTAIDAAVQSKALGAEEVTICYRGPRERMKASHYEQELAQTRGVSIRCDMVPTRIIPENGKLAGIEFVHGSETIFIACDQIFKAIGQKLDAALLEPDGKTIRLENGRIAVDPEGRTSASNVWAGGDCVNAGDDLTVTAVSQGRDAAMSIHGALTAVVQEEPING